MDQANPSTYQKDIKISIKEPFFIKGIPLIFRQWKIWGDQKLKIDVYNEAYDDGNSDV